MAKNWPKKAAIGKTGHKQAWRPQTGGSAWIEVGSSPGTSVTKHTVPGWWLNIGHMYHKLQQGTEPSFTVSYWLTLHSKDHLRQHTIFIYKVFCNALVTIRRFSQSFVLCPSSLHLGKDRFKDLVWIKGRGEKSTMKIFICYLHLTSASPRNLGRSMAPQNWAGEGPVTHHHIKDGQLVAGFS